MNHSIALSVVFLLLAAGCYEDNSAYNPDLQSCKSSSPACPATAPICDDDNTCVQCTPTNKDACVGAAPICGMDRFCHPCTSHDQCDSKACLPSGECADATKVAYVVVGGSPGTGACDRSSPCGTLWQGVQSNKDVIKIGPGTFKPDDSVVIERVVTIVAEPGTVLDRNLDGNILDIRGKSGSPTKVHISDVEITGSSMGNAIDVSANGSAPTFILNRVSIHDNQGLGIYATNSTVHVFRSMISENASGGVSLNNTAFKLISNFFFRNGDSAKTVGGLYISTSSNAENRLEFNTFHRNEAQDGVGNAIQCVAGPSFAASNNILFGNATSTSMLQTSGTCAHTYSLVQPGPMPATGAFNFADDPKFVAGATGELRLTATSPAKGKADPAADLTGEALVDINGDKRTKVPADIGADQLP
jgi:Right handed beta helix region